MTIPPVSSDHSASSSAASSAANATAASSAAAPLIISYSQMEAAHGSIEALSSLQSQLSSLLAPYQLADMNVAMILAEGSDVDSDGNVQSATDGWSGLFAESKTTDPLYKDVPGS